MELQADKPLSESGVPEKDESDMSGENGVPIIVAVRKHLVAEGWKMVHNDAMDSDTEKMTFRARIKCGLCHIDLVLLSLPGTII